MIQAIRSLWPEGKSAPLVHLVRAMLLAPLMLCALLAIGAFLTSGMAEAQRTDALATTIESTISMASMVFLFTFTFGLVGIIALGMMGLRGTLPWAAMGGLMGGLAATLSGFLSDGTPHRIMVMAVALMGWVLFLLMRWLASVKSEPKRG
ncbi:MAG: hypothetical protein AB8B85_10890 [Paracoccaceae bacterium]